MITCRAAPFTARQGYGRGRLLTTALVLASAIGLLLLPAALGSRPLQQLPRYQRQLSSSSDVPPPVLPSPSPPLAPGTPFPEDRRFEDCYAVCRRENPGIDPYLMYCDKYGNRYDNQCWAICSFAEGPLSEYPAANTAGGAAAAASLQASLPSPSPLAPGTPFPADRRFEDCYAVCRRENPGIDPYLMYCDKYGNRYDKRCWAICSFAEGPLSECPADTAGGSAAAASLPASLPSPSPLAPGTSFPEDRRFEDCYAVCRRENPGFNPYLLYCDNYGNRYDNLCWAICSFAEGLSECPAAYTAGGSPGMATSILDSSLSSSSLSRPTDDDESIQFE
ncbi:hypothetical protein PLESTF_000883100 [Pleodorina starrii]|nr:hypothetical protein PLESTF_000883100 [Pleodorina starrii]